MAVSVVDLFSIGIGPSSSHTVGPMRAARRFATALAEHDLLGGAVAVRVELYGSLAATGRGHGTDRAVLLGLEGHEPETVAPDLAGTVLDRVRDRERLCLLGRHEIRFSPIADLVLDARTTLPRHPNGMRFTAYDAGGAVLRQTTSYSVGGGFVVDEDEPAPAAVADADVPYPFASGAALLALCASRGLAISDVVLANERAVRPEEEVLDHLDRVWAVMQECVETGCRTEGVLPGGLGVRRRAPALLRRLSEDAGNDPLRTLDWIDLFALAVNEQNAGGGRVVTAPTNGAAGIIPAVLHYYVRFCPGADGDKQDGVRRFLLTAGAIGSLYQRNASISGAEVGCQGEVGSASSMAAAGLCEVLGGTPAQVENAAEIAMEHNLGLTCDPVGGLVQIPCIERNAMAAVKAVNAVRMALAGAGEHVVSLDQVIATMRETGADMATKYKETSLGGLAVNVIEC